MEKLDVEKAFPQSKGDFIPVPGSFTVEGWDSVVMERGTPKERTAKVVRFLREDGVAVVLFADQLRREGEKLLVSKAHFDKQVARADEWAAGRRGVPKK